MPKLYTERPGKVLEAGERFRHVMALVLNPYEGSTEGLIRCITSRVGDVAEKTFIDRSELYTVTRSGDTFLIQNKLHVAGEEAFIKQLEGSEWECIGLEDPDLWFDKETNRLHLYFTIAMRNVHHGGVSVGLGHASGESLNSLNMRTPVLLPTALGGRGAGAKEVVIMPKNSEGVRLNLVESWDPGPKYLNYSVVRVAVAEEMHGPWEYGDIVFHPGEHRLSWVKAHASPGPLLPRTFIDLGEGRLVGFMNGRAKDVTFMGITRYGTFSVGLCIYNYERGLMEWVSPDPFIQDSEARTITFASYFEERDSGKGILYAHVDDSFVRAYEINAEDIKKILP
jgi:hypothetical protein